jgi:16S rRNA (uracil1498-N3)-methyltransferase
MPRFFLPEISGGYAVLTGEDARHITKSLRMRTGEEIILCDGRGTDFHGRVSVLGEEVGVEILSSGPSRSEPAARLTLYQALPKADKLDFIVQKAVELGVSEIVPVLTSRCVSRPDGKAMEKKRERLAKTALEAAKQSGRGIIPEVAPLADFSGALACMKQAGLAILCYERAELPLREALRGKAPASVAVMIGSEGGFSREEAAGAEALGIPAVSLGSRILRCETAPVCALSAILYALGEL